MNYEQIKPFLTDNETEGEPYESYAVKHGYVIFLRSQQCGGAWFNANYFQIFPGRPRLVGEPTILCVQLNGHPQSPNNYKFPKLEEFNARVYKEFHET